MRRIILRHISGSKANEVNEFLVDQFQALTLGRDTDNHDTSLFLGRTIWSVSSTPKLSGRQDTTTASLLPI